MYKYAIYIYVLLYTKIAQASDFLAYDSTNATEKNIKSSSSSSSLKSREQKRHVSLNSLGLEKQTTDFI